MSSARSRPINIQLFRTSPIFLPSKYYYNLVIQFISQKFQPPITSKPCAGRDTLRINPKMMHIPTVVAGAQTHNNPTSDCSLALYRPEAKQWTGVEGVARELRWKWSGSLEWRLCGQFMRPPARIRRFSAQGVCKLQRDRNTLYGHGQSCWLLSLTSGSARRDKPEAIGAAKGFVGQAEGTAN